MPPGRHAIRGIEPDGFLKIFQCLFGLLERHSDPAAGDQSAGVLRPLLDHLVRELFGLGTFPKVEKQPCPKSRRVCEHIVVVLKILLRQLRPCWHGTREELFRDSRSTVLLQKWRQGVQARIDGVQ